MCVYECNTNKPALPKKEKNNTFVFYFFKIANAFYIIPEQKWLNAHSFIRSNSCSSSIDWATQKLQSRACGQTGLSTFSRKTLLTYALINYSSLLPFHDNHWPSLALLFYLGAQHAMLIWGWLVVTLTMRPKQWENNVSPPLVVTLDRAPNGDRILRPAAVHDLLLCHLVWPKTIN